MDVRKAVLSALDTTCGLYDKPQFAAAAHGDADLILSQLDLDSLSTYEIIMALEETLEIEIQPEVIFRSKTLSEVVAALEDLLARPVPG
ncbi:acyl carrier protein [Aliigemmobacter aestuarii]|uniref:Acyl carrier protein n=1 Tax=Aliigemmobacter aestuarii TaxID=1445661 RepID=A0A4S3MLW1_9RHOB|nr:acyl carrier protein [Gemmobacter aestuarii]THD83097.1 acyl carrier protein [Gemmobacter aestuarii]